MVHSWAHSWQQQNNHWWLTDFTALPDTSALHQRALHGYWQIAPYEAVDFTGTMILANPFAAAPEIHIPLPVPGRYSIALGLPENYCDRVLIKLKSDSYFDKLAHAEVSPNDMALQECWWRDLDLVAGDVLVIKQDDAMKRRCGVAYIRLYPAPSPTAPEFPFFATADGSPGNNGAISLDEMMAEELQFVGTHVSAICHGTDISGLAQYMTKLPGHRYPAERVAEEEFIASDYYPWGVEQLLKYEAEGRCPLDDSITAAHKIGRKLYAYHRMGITRLYAPMRMFENPMYDAHPEWRCIDFDGTPISRLSICYPEVRQYFLEHFRETIERGADGVCLVFARGWPLILFEEPVAEEFERQTGIEMSTAMPDDPDLLAVRTDFFNDFMREIHETVTAAGQGRATEVIALTLATPEINRSFGMDCARWAQEGWVDILIPYPYGYTAEATAINVPEWMPVIADTNAKLCPILNRMTYEPAGVHESPDKLLDRAEKWLSEGAHGLAVWDLDSSLASPTYRRLAYNIASAEGRACLREIFAAGTVRHFLKTLDGLAVDRYHPGWNV